MYSLIICGYHSMTEIFLHLLISSITILFSFRTYNVVDIRGDFSLYEIHSWVTQCLQDIPDKPPASDIVVYRFESALLSTILQVQYR